MIQLSDYLDPVSLERPLWSHLPEVSCLSHNFTINTESSPVEDIEEGTVVLLGITDDRRSPNKGSGQAPEKIREALYLLARLPGKQNIYDLGNLKKGQSFGDTLAALKDLSLYLLSKNCQLIILGGNSAIIPAIDNVMSEMGTRYNYTSVDSRIDMCSEKDNPDSFNYLQPILYKKDNSSLAAFTGIGYQSYLNDQQVINRLKKMNHMLVRLGELRNDLHEYEPVFRDSGLITFDISSVRQSDAPGTYAPSPNGLYTEEICLLSRFAGLSDNMKVFGIFEVNPVLDSSLQTSSLAAQIIWFLLEGMSVRTNESQLIGKDKNGRFIQYHIRPDDLEEDIVFIKSTITNRWWMEVKPTGAKDKIYIACSYNDYLKAGEGQIPERWMRAIS